MTGKADFTEQEWELVREGPTVAGMYALMASKGGQLPRELGAREDLRGGAPGAGRE